MKLASAFLKLVRWPNLAFIVITQLLFYYCVYKPLVSDAAPVHSDILFFLLVIASVLIAAAGYIINDYFDLQIDSINKPGKIIVDRYIKRRWAILWHLLLSGAGMLCSIFISYKTGVWLIAFINFVCVLLLWIYSASLKKKLLAGNIIIAALAAWVIFSAYFFAGADMLSFKGWKDAAHFDQRRFFKFTLLYAGFAFIMTIIREVIKDMEDMEGDRKHGCRTMPIVWGVPASKIFTAVWLIVVMGTLTILQVYAWQSGRYYAAIYNLALIILPLLFILRKLYEASLPADYHRLSTLVKMAMLFGILSMLFLKFTV